jgi:hypothetical protein
MATADTLAYATNKAVAKAGSTYDPTKFDQTGGWGTVKGAAIKNALSFYKGSNQQFADPNQPTTPATPATPATPTDHFKPADLTSGQNAASAWNLENDPLYQMAMRQGQSSFNIARANALAAMQNQTTGLNRAQANMENSAIGSRRQLAGNFAARGMQRGGYGAYYRAQDQMNAEQIAKTTDIRDQIASLSQDYLGKFGATSTDWTATGVGQEYKNQAAQQALNAQIARYGTI